MPHGSVVFRRAVFANVERHWANDEKHVVNDAHEKVDETFARHTSAFVPVT